MDSLNVKTVYAPARPKGAALSQEIYNGAELRRAPGVLPERFKAFTLPSRIGNKLHYPNGDVKCVTDSLTATPGR